uniref:GDNF-inducible zinc finger protein 1 n=1 Tax=Culex pipiens TaxID=7175 RepID=A0A8D8CHN2_CULPI
MDQLCRICLTSIAESNSTNLLTSLVSNETTLWDMLNAICSPVFSSTSEDEDSKTLPLDVCLECTGKILSSYELFQLCITSNKKLREMLLEQNKPVEVIDVPDTVEDEVEPNEGPSVKVDKSCEICHRVLKTSKSLSRHMTKIHQIKALTCDDCQQDFYSEESLQEHKLHHETEQLYDCPNCDSRFPTSSALKDHQQQVHSAGTTFLCTTCGKSFNNRSNLRQHSVRHSSQKRFACGECPARFHSKGSLKNHQLVHTKERPFGCDVCGTRFTMKHSLVKHRQIHTGEERPFGCSMCKQRFRNKHHLDRHQRVHSGEKPFKCKLCDRAFAQSNDLIKHSRTQHFGENLYPCSRCEGSFRLLVELKDHYRVHFQGEEDHIVEEAGEEVRFTSVSMIERRLEQKQEKMREEQGSRRRQQKEGKSQIRLEQVVAPSVNIPTL